MIQPLLHRRRGEVHDRSETINQIIDGQIPSNYSLNSLSSLPHSPVKPFQDRTESINLLPAENLIIQSKPKRDVVGDDEIESRIKKPEERRKPRNLPIWSMVAMAQKWKNGEREREREDLLLLFLHWKGSKLNVPLLSGPKRLRERWFQGSFFPHLRGSDYLVSHYYTLSESI